MPPPTLILNHRLRCSSNLLTRRGKGWLLATLVVHLGIRPSTHAPTHPPTHRACRVEYWFRPVAPRNGAEAAAAIDADLDRYMHTAALNRGERERSPWGMWRRVGAGGGGGGKRPGWPAAEEEGETGESGGRVKGAGGVSLRW
jgi:hypothetical protein